MYRALYAHKSKLPKYLSFEAGDRFTLIDTSVSDQWFLAQNGLGEIGYVPFNYIKRMDATTEQQVKFIDGGMEAIHLQATSAGGQYTQDQRLIMKKLVKHRSDVIKRASATESQNSKESGRRRPAPAPPMEKTASLDTTSTSKPASLAVVGRSVTLASASTDQSPKHQVANDVSNGRHDGHKSKTRHKVADSHSKSKRASTASESARPAPKQEQDNVKKSVSVTSSIGQAPSLVSSMSSQSTDLDCPSEVTSNTGSTMSGQSDPPGNGRPVPVEMSPGDVDKSQEVTCDTVEMHPEVTPGKGETSENDEANTRSPQPSIPSHSDSNETSRNNLVQRASPYDFEVNKANNTTSSGVTSSCEESHDSTASSSLAEVNDLDLDFPGDDLPPPPPEIYEDGMEDDRFSDYMLPPAPDLTTPGREDVAPLAMQTSVESDASDLYAFNVMQECSCEDFHPDVSAGDGEFYARGSLALPHSRKVVVTPNDRKDPDSVLRAISSLCTNPSTLADLDADKKLCTLQQLEQIQAGCINVTHADCEEIIGKFQQVSQLSHEESHWALMTALSLFSAKVPHIQPALEVLALRFVMAHECQSTGKDYKSEDAVTLDHLICELDTVMNNSQQRGHYLEDDLSDITDTISQLSETLKKAKHCVSLAAIQKENFAMIEVIAKYYQMETRWPIRALLLDLVEIICRLHHQAVPEFLYSVLPLELVAEMQQYSNDDARFLLVAKTLGVVFMRGKSSPHKLSLTMDLHFFIWLLGMIENYDERCRHDDVEHLVALVCAYHLQHRDEPQNPVTEALKMAQGHALLECSLLFLSKHGDPTHLLGSTVTPKVNSVILLLTHLYDSSDTSDLLYTNDVEALVGIFEEFFRDLSSGDSMRKEMLQLLRNFLRCYPDTLALKDALCDRLGPLLVSIRAETKNSQSLAAQILDDNRPIFED